MHAIFQKKGGKRLRKCYKRTKKDQIFENLGTKVQNLKTL